MADDWEFQPSPKQRQWALERIAQRTEPEPDGIQDVESNVWTALSRPRRREVSAVTIPEPVYWLVILVLLWEVVTLHSELQAIREEADWLVESVQEVAR